MKTVSRVRRYGGQSIVLGGLGLLSLGAAAKHDDASIEELLVEGTHSSIAAERAAAARIPGGVTVVNIDDLKDRNIASLSDVTRYVPGVWSASSSGTDSIFFSSRGSNLDATDYDENGIKLMQDGLAVTTADGNNHNRVIDPLSAQGATFARGANAMTYGASTLGGAVNFITPTARDRDGYELRITGGSHGLGTLRATAAAATDTLDGLLTVEARTWDGYREHNDQDRSGAYGNVGWQVSDKVSTRFYATYLDNDQELPGGLTRAQFEDDPDQANFSAANGDFQLNVETWRLANRTSWALGQTSRLEFGLSVEEQRLYHPIVDQILVDFDGAGPAQPVEVFSLLIDTEHRDLGAMLRFTHQTVHHDLVFGINWGSNDVDGAHYRNLQGERNGLTNLIDNEAESWEIFASDHWALTESLTLVMAAQAVIAERGTRNTNVGNGNVVAPRGDYDAVNPRLGVIYLLNESVSVYGNVSRLYEPPTSFELEDDARASGDPLDAMQGTVLEVGTRGNHALTDKASWYWDASLYYAEIKDEILSVEDPAAPGTSLATNVDDTLHAGLEVAVGAEFVLDSGSLAPTLAVSLNHFEFDGDPVYGNRELPAAPDYVVRGELMYRHPTGFYAGPTFDFVGARWADFANSYKIDAYQLLGLRAGYERSDLRVFVEVQNLTDEKYVATHSVRNVASADAALLHPGAPLSVYAGVTYAF